MNRIGLIAVLGVAAAAGPAEVGPAEVGPLETAPLETAPLETGATPPASLCVTNASDGAYHFTVRAVDGTARAGRALAPGETLCLADPGRGVVAAFESAQSLEGCSRLVPAGGSATLLAFGRFDRCAWAGPDG